MSQDEKDQPERSDSTVLVDLPGDNRLVIRGHDREVGTLAELFEAALSRVDSSMSAESMPPPSGLQAHELPREPPEALLIWQSVATAAAYCVIRDHETLEPSVKGQSIYIDNTVRVNRPYSYAVASVAADGRPGRASDPIPFVARGATPADGPPGREPANAGMTVTTGVNLDWIPNIGDPPYGAFTMWEPPGDFGMEIPMLLEQRSQIMAAMAVRSHQRSLTGPTLAPPGQAVANDTYISVPVAYESSFTALGSPDVAKSLNEFIGDLNGIGAGLVLRVTE
jgi:hypothetical protein